MHWACKPDSDDYTTCRLPDPVKQFAKPADHHIMTVTPPS